MTEVEQPEDGGVTNTKGTRCFQEEEGLAKPNASSMSGEMRTEMSPWGLCHGWRLLPGWVTAVQIRKQE